MAANDQDLSRRRRWEDRTRAPLLIGSAFFLLAYSVLILVPPMGTAWRAVVIALLSLVWAAYIVDLIVRVVFTPPGHRSEFIRTHPVDTVSAVIPWVRPCATVVSFLSERIAHVQQQHVDAQKEPPVTAPAEDRVP